MQGPKCDLVLFSLIAFLLVPSPAGAQGAPSPPPAAPSGVCHLLDSSTAVPADFGAAYDLFSSEKEVILTVQCGPSSNARLTVGNGQSNLYIYKTAYEWTGSGWRERALSGPLSEGSWYIGSAVTDLPRSETQPAEDNFVIAYTCLLSGRQWKCGCRDTSCARNYWQLQAFNSLLVQEPTDLVPGELPEATRMINVSSSSQLQSAVNNARPGDHILLADGKYSSRLTIDEQGTQSAPIVIRAANILGAHLAGGFTLTPDSRHIWLYGVDLKDTRNNELQGQDHVLRRIRVWPPFVPTSESKGIVPSNGKNARIDYCELRLYSTSEVQQKHGRIWGNSTYAAVWNYYRGNDWFDNLVIERCLLTGGPNDTEYAQPNSQFVETSGRDQSGTGHDLNWVIRDVYGDVTRDRTLFDFKHKSLHLERVHIKSRNGVIQVRNACCHSVKESRFQNTYISVRGDNNIVENNVASRLLVHSGNVAWNNYENASAHRQAYKTKLSHNTGSLHIGYGPSNHNVPALATLVEAHSGSINYGRHSDTTVLNSSAVAKRTPVTLSPSEVGPFAPWVGIE